MEKRKRSHCSEGDTSANDSSRTVLDVLSLPDRERHVMQYLLRSGSADAAEVARQTGQSEDAVHRILEELADQGFVRCIEQAEPVLWRAHLARKAQRTSSIWDQLDDQPE